MTDPLRRALAVALSIACLAAAWAFSAKTEASQLHAATRSAHDAAESHARQLVDRLKDSIRANAKRATSLQGVNAIVAATGSADRVGTDVQDQFTTEEATKPYRDMGLEFAFFIGELLVTPSGPVPDDVLKALATEAAASGHAETVVGSTLVGAALLDTRTRNSLQAVVVTMLPLDRGRLEKLLPGETLALVTTGETLALGSHEQQLRVFLSKNDVNAACCSRVEVSPGVSLWAWQDPDPLLVEAEHSIGTTRALSFGGALALSLLALTFGFWRSKSPDQDQLLRDTAVQLQRSREELMRVSQIVSASSSTLSSPAKLDSTQITAQSRYEIIDLLGEGGMARVYVAVARGAEGFKRTFVVKRLRPELTDNTEVVNQFIDEARLSASLVHSNIVPVFDFGRDNEGYFIAQEYILGRNIEALVRRSVERRHRALDVELVLLLAQESLKALTYAHEKRDETGKPLGLVHRDVSPNNLMVSADGELKLLDFGIVKSEGRVTQTQAGTVKGNLFYMSPEQARGSNVDLRSDLYSLALVLYYAATAEPLFTGNTTHELLTRAATGVIQTDAVRIQLVQEPLGSILLKALSPGPAQRYQSSELFAKAIAATGHVAPASVLRDLMMTLFRDDFAAEQQRFSKRKA